MLKAILDEVHKHDIAPDALPVMHISGCTSSCGTHQIGKIGFHGKVKMVNNKPAAGFVININGCDKQGAESFGNELGVIAADDIPSFVAELGMAVTGSGMSYDEFAAKNEDKIIEIVKKYL